MHLGFKILLLLVFLHCRVNAPKDNIYDPKSLLGGTASVIFGILNGVDVKITTRYLESDYPTFVKTEYLDLNLSEPVSSFFSKSDFQISNPYQNDLILRDVYPLSEKKLRVLFSVSSRSEWREPVTITITRPKDLKEYEFLGKQLTFRFPYPRYFGSISEAKGYITTTKLLDGKILLVGGVNPSGNTVPTVEIWNPETGSTELLPPLNQSLMGLSVCRFNNGKVVVSGGKSKVGKPTINSDISDRIFLIDPLQKTVDELPIVMQKPRHGHVMVCLNTGDLLVSGGQFKVGDDPSAIANDHEYISLSQFTSTIIGGSSDFSIGIHFHTAEYDEINSRVLYFGGRDRQDQYALFSNRVFSIDTNTFSMQMLTGVFPTGRANVTYVKMPNSDYVLFGGTIREATGTKAIESWNEKNATTSSLGFTSRFKNGSGIAQFSDEQVFYTGGVDTYYKSGILELYDHFERKNFIVDTMMLPRSEHSAIQTTKGIAIFGDSANLDTRVELYGKD
ncbi:kelch-like protein [Leptospira yanagawae]|uniref:Kelch-like protein n=1 Tax=Leptospira yanagawae TaxID=293069 RepID=A0ABY2M4C2_9LEPT|nr:kelch repeat-containing protein [Leptospira yanagawae]TGL20925.1 kelch-like protein [Leptospira yanagawae]